jgi:aryl carrier-like protein
MYGPTETTVWSGVSRVKSGDGPVTIGPPIANTRFYVVDRAGRLSPIGVPGELWIGGDGVARGYWNDAKQTAEKFIRDPFSHDPEAHVYRTGDLVRALPSGQFEFLGRLDTQVKVRGFRIETSEVELALAQHDAVHECVVVVREDVPGDKRLVAYFVPGAEPPANSDLRGFVAARLPEYMVPSAFVKLDRLPRTPNGKIDRRALPAVDIGALQGDREYVAPRSPREDTLSRIAAEVLALPRVSVEDSLFDLGADSLHIFRMVARATETGLHLTLKQVLEHRTVAAISADMESRGPIVQKESGPQLVAAARERYRVRRSELLPPEPAVARGSE